MLTLKQMPSMPRPTLIVKSSVIDKFHTRPGRERAVPKFDHTPDLRSAGQLMAAHCIKWGSSGFDLVGPLLGNPPIVGLEDSPQISPVLLVSLERPPSVRETCFLEYHPPVQLPRARRWNLWTHHWNHWNGPKIKVSMTPAILVPC